MKSKKYSYPLKIVLGMLPIILLICLGISQNESVECARAVGVGTEMCGVANFMATLLFVGAIIVIPIIGIICSRSWEKSPQSRKTLRISFSVAYSFLFIVALKTWFGYQIPLLNPTQSLLVSTLILGVLFYFLFFKTWESTL